MSDAMTNREIEDVLTSIRRLVAQDGDRAPAASGKLILTEDLRVAQPATGGEPVPEAEAPAPAEAAPVPAAETMPRPDFGQLEATIAELEAAVSASGQTWEAEATPDEAPRASNVTDLYGRLSFRHRDPEPEHEASAAAPADAPPPAVETREAPSAADPVPRVEPVEAVDSAETVDPVDSADEAERVEETVIDEAMLRALVAQIVREELHGQLGERITQQVRKLVRTEIARALDERKFL